LGETVLPKVNLTGMTPSKNSMLYKTNLIEFEHLYQIIFDRIFSACCTSILWGEFN